MDDYSRVYHKTHNGKKYEIERFPDGTWFLFVKEREDEPREYVLDFCTKREAIQRMLQEK
ncbi:hypothetical protein EVB81_187 [Rhizobium phage RHph_I46]|nr:hypothetical protein EVB81_187 [Rhizobium phage RHph_I46]QIG71037.1 hypothetical protein EVB92_187 [Rhizobium phage RHph_I9]QIG76376.1 hypothetical protein EVC25_187 [Rhizobium phage RHph_I34]